MNKIEKIVKAKQSEARAVEMAEMKRLYTAFLESGLEIDTACELLRNKSIEKVEETEKFSNDSNELERISCEHRGSITESHNDSTLNHKSESKTIDGMNEAAKKCASSP